MKTGDYVSLKNARGLEEYGLYEGQCGWVSSDLEGSGAEEDKELIAFFQPEDMGGEVFAIHSYRLAVVEGKMA